MLPLRAMASQLLLADPDTVLPLSPWGLRANLQSNSLPTGANTQITWEERALYCVAFWCLPASRSVFWAQAWQWLQWSHWGLAQLPPGSDFSWFS